MTGWPTLDGSDAERAIAEMLAAVVGPVPPSELVETIVAALNDADVVLCDHTALTDLRQRAIDAEALIDELREWTTLENDARMWSAPRLASELLARHNLTADPKDCSR